MNSNEFVITNRHSLKQYLGRDKEVWIPDGVTRIGEKAFDRCEHIRIVHIPESVTEIAERAFRLCINLREVYLPSQLKTLKQSAFKGCQKLHSIHLPPSLEAIRDSALSQCEALCEICVPDSVHEIGNNAFFGCSKVAAVTIPANQIPNLENAFSSSNARRLTLNGAFSRDVEAVNFYCFEKLESVFAPMIKLNAVKGSIRKLFLNGFLANPDKYHDDVKSDYVRYLNAQRKRLLSQAVADDNVAVFEVYEQLAIALPMTLLNELIELAEKSRKNGVYAWLTSYRNNVSGQAQKPEKPGCTSRQPIKKVIDVVGVKQPPETLEGEHTIICGGRTIVAINNVKKQMRTVRYNQKYDLLTAADYYMSSEEAEENGIDPLSVVSFATPYVKEAAPLLSAQQINERKLWFIAACSAAATQSGMEIIVQTASKKKDGTLMKNRIVHIATLQMVDQRANTWELYAKAISDTIIEIGIRKTVCKDSEISRIKGIPAGQQDLADVSTAFQAICAEFSDA